MKTDGGRKSSVTGAFSGKSVTGTVSGTYDHDPVPENGSDSGYPGAHCTGTVTYTAQKQQSSPGR